MLGGTLAAVLGIGMLPADVHAEGADGQTGLPAPVLYASFDNANAEDSSGNGNNGTVIGTPEFVDGVSGKAVHIVNSGDIAGSGADAEQYISFGTPEDLLFGTDDFSIAFWYRSDRSSDDHKEGSIVSNKDWASGNNQGLNFGDMRQGINMNYRAGGNGRKETDRYSEITDGEWHFITGTFDRDGQMTLYIDGELPTEGNGYQAGAPQVSIADQNSSIDAFNFTVGADGKGKYGLLNGYIDELSVYREVLTQEQVKELGKTDSTGDTGNDAPVLDVTFDDSAATDSVAGNNGTITRDVEFVDGVSGKAVRISNPEDIAGKNTTAEQYIDFGAPNELQFGTGDFTVMFWYQSDGTLPGEGAVVSNKDWSTGSNPGFAIGDMKQGMTLNFRAQDSSGRLDTSRYGGATEAGVWHHIAAVFNRTGNMTLYVDGSAAASQSISAQAGKSIDVTNFVVGADGKHQCGVQDSYIDELKVYKKALTADEIADYTAPFVLQNKLDEYEALIESSSASDEKKTAFQSAIDDIRARAEGVTDISAIRALEDELKAAYNEFTGPEDGIMSFEVISDAHISGTNNSASPNQKLIDAMDDIANDYASGVSAVLNCGDYSNYASVSETQGYFNIIAPYKDQFEILTAMGNHDVRWLSGGWEEAEGRYLEYNQDYMGDTPDGQSYFDKWIGGYHFIVLNTQWDTKDRAYLSPEELDWFEETLAEDASPDKPIFVVLHQPLYDTYTNSNAWPAGAQDHQIKEILRDYPQTVMFNGHIHDGLGAIEVKQTDYGVMVDVPGMNSNDYGDGRGQLGFHVTVYDGKVRLDLRDYANDEWVSEYTYEFEISEGAYPEGKTADISFDDETASDSTGNGNDAVIHGDADFAEGVDGGKAVHISDPDPDSADQYVELSSGLIFGRDASTLMFWYKAGQDAEGTDLADGKWHAVSAVFQNSEMTLYIDGAKADEKESSAWDGEILDSSALQWLLGEEVPSDYYLDNIKIYGNAVNANEISTTWTPYELTADQDSITVSWPLPTDSVEPAYLLLNGEKVTDIASGATQAEITGLEPGTTYTVALVNHEKSNARNLRDVFGFRVTTKADKSALEELYNANKDKDVSGYTDSSVQAWKDALAAAEEVLNDPSASTDEVQNAYDQLSTALDGLKLKADTSKLAALAGTVQELLGSDAVSQYTDDSIQALKDALADAEALLAQDLSEEAQAQVDASIDFLQTAVDSLVKIDEGTAKPGQDQPDGSGDKPDSQPGSGNAPSSQKSDADGSVPQTGDSSAFGLWLALAAAAASALLLSGRNRKRTK